MRKPLIAGNWKMHGSSSQVNGLTKAIVAGVSAYPHIDVVLIPTFVHLWQVAQHLAGSPQVALGAQNLYLGNQGAFTGEVSGPMLSDLGCQYVLVGHSERRTLFHEDLPLVAAKCQAALAAGLVPILCIGETLEERETRQTEVVLARQLNSVISLIGIQAFDRLVIAYEPVWAIGTGVTATPEQAQETHAFIRHFIQEVAEPQNNLDIAKTIRILYGGSMKPDNASQLLAMPDIDGGLIGGASLDAHSFLAICQAANAKVKSNEFIH